MLTLEEKYALRKLTIGQVEAWDLILDQRFKKPVPRWTRAESLVFNILKKATWLSPRQVKLLAALRRKFKTRERQRKNVHYDK